MLTIQEYSPFKTRNDLLGQFEQITGDSGTLVIIYNLKLCDEGTTELDLTTDPFDIRRRYSHLNKKFYYFILNAFRV